MLTAHESAATSDVEARPPRSTVMRWVVAALALLPPAAHGIYLVVNDRNHWTYLFADDAYYYLGVARNIAAGNGSTFGGLTETNGYHPLWEAALSVLAFVVRDRYALILAVVALLSVLWVLLLAEALKIGRALGSEPAAVLGVTLLGVLAIGTGQLSFNGMESAALCVLMLVVIRLIVTLRHDSRDEWLLGVVFSLVVLTRLDAALTVGPVAVVAALQDRPPTTVLARRGVRLLAPTVLALVMYVAANSLLFGTATPVSGQAKALGAPFTNTKAMRGFLQAGEIGGRPLWLGAVALAVTALAYALGDWRATTAARRIMAITAALLVGQALLLTYLTFATSYPLWPWYHSNVALLLFTGGTLVALGATRRVGGAATSMCLLAGAAFAIVQGPAMFLSTFNHSSPSTATAAFLADELPGDAVLAMGDRAGLVGYLVDRPMLQLEGLVSDAEWLDDLEDGTAIDRMIAEGVDYLVVSGIPVVRDVPRGGLACQAITEPRAGRGPKFEVIVCPGDEVFAAGSGRDGFTVYRFEADNNG